MYYEYWGLNRQPFDNVPDPTMYFRAHESVEQAVAEVLFAIEEGDDCLAVVVGEVGLGKTTSLRVILDSLDPAKYRIAFVTNPDVTFTMLLRDIVGQLKGQVCPVTRKDDLLEEFNRLLFATADEGKRIVIFIDEGNAFKPANLESLRLLTNMQMDDRNLFTIVLAGQPKLARMLEAPRHANLFQRVGVYCRLEKMPSWEVVRDYIDHRLERAGCKTRIFSDDAMKAIFTASEQGVPRLVNKIAKLALKAGQTNGLKEIDPGLVSAIGDRFKRFTARPDKKSAEEPSDESVVSAVSRTPAAKPEAPVVVDEAVSRAPEPAPVAAEPASDAVPVVSEPVSVAPEPVDVAPEERPAPELVAEAFEPFELPIQTAAPAPHEGEPVREELAPVGASRMDDNEYMKIRHGEEAAAPNGNGSGDQPLVTFTQVCLDEALRPEVMERARAANKTERIKMAGQLAAEEIKRHPEVITQVQDPVVMWKELRNEILSAFAAEVNS